MRQAEAWRWHWAGNRSAAAVDAVHLHPQLEIRGARVEQRHQLHVAFSGERQAHGTNRQGQIPPAASIEHAAEAA